MAGTVSGCRARAALAVDAQRLYYTNVEHGAVVSAPK
jgi:hypothetical protein